MKMGIERVLNENFLNMGGVSDDTVHDISAIDVASELVGCKWPVERKSQPSCARPSTLFTVSQNHLRRGCSAVSIKK